MAISVSGQQRSEQFWTSTDFSRKCDGINRLVMGKGAGYQQLLGSVFGHLTSYPSVHRYQYVSGNLNTIYHKMPVDIKSKKGVVENVERIEKLFCSCFQQLRKVMVNATSVIQLDEFEKIVSSISIQLPDTIGPELKKEMKESADFYISKRSTFLND